MEEAVNWYVLGGGFGGDSESAKNERNFKDLNPIGKKRSRRRIVCGDVMVGNGGHGARV